MYEEDTGVMEPKEFFGSRARMSRWKHSIP